MENPGREKLRTKKKKIYYIKNRYKREEMQTTNINIITLNHLHHHTCTIY